MLVSNCCGARFHEPDYPDNDICSACGEHAGAEEEDEPSVIVMDIPRVDPEVHNHPLGAGFAHKDHKDNG